MLSKSVEELYKKIAETNSNLNVDSIPSSDVFLRKMESTMGISIGELTKIISILRDCHKILIIELEKEDKAHDNKKIEGYVAADLEIIKNLKNYYQSVLEEGYNKQYNTRLHIYQIIKEIFPKLASLKNTPLGQIANKAIMLDEFQKYIEKVYEEFTPDWQEKKYNEIISFYEKGESAEEQIKEDYSVSSSDERRAIDDDQYKDFKSGAATKAVNKLLQIYGVDFFFRVYLRKYEFDFLKNVIDAGHIDKKTDLKLLKSMLKKIRLNFDKDDKLIEHSEELYQLEKAVTKMLLFKH